MKTIIFDIGGVLFKPDYQQTLVPIKEGVALLLQCVQKGHHVYICTNYTSQIVDQLTTQYPECFPQALKGYITPEVAAAKKPQPGVFQFLLATYNLIAEESVFIDDSLPNIYAARQAGFIGIHATDMSVVKAELQALNLV